MIIRWQILSTNLLLKIFTVSIFLKRTPSNPFLCLHFLSKIKKKDRVTCFTVIVLTKRNMFVALWVDFAGRCCRGKKKIAFPCLDEPRAIVVAGLSFSLWYNPTVFPSCCYQYVRWELNSCIPRIATRFFRPVKRAINKNWEYYWSPVDYRRNCINVITRDKFFTAFLKFSSPRTGNRSNKSLLTETMCTRLKNCQLSMIRA